MSTSSADRENTKSLYWSSPEGKSSLVERPTEGVGDTKLTATKEDYENIRMGTVTCEHEDENTVTIPVCHPASGVIRAVRPPL